MIDRILDTIHYGEWLGDFLSGKDQYLSFGYLHYYGETTAHHYLPLIGVTSVVISGREYLLNTAEQRDTYRQQIAVASLRTLLERQLSHRQGFRGYRGYFRLLCLLPWNDPIMVGKHHAIGQISRSTGGSRGGWSENRETGQGRHP